MQAAHMILARRWWRTLLLATVVAGACGFVLAQGLAPTYEAQTKLLVGPISAEFNVLHGSSELTQTYAELASSQPVLEAVISKLGLGLEWQELQAAITIQADTTTRVITIQAPAASPDLAAKIANALGAQMLTIDTTIPKAPEGQLTIIEPAVQPLEPSGPGPQQVTLLAAAAGFVGAVLVIIGVEYMTDTIRDRHDLPPSAQERLLGLVQARGTGRAPGPHLLVVDAKGTADSEAGVGYRLLASQLLTADVEATPTWVVLAIGRGDGAGEATANLGSALTAARQRVRVLDANPFQREVAAVFGDGYAVDVNDIVQYDLSSRRARTRTIVRGAIGEAAQGPGSVNGRRAFDRMVANTDIMVINPPASEQSLAGMAWAQFATATLLVAQVEQTSRRSLAHAIEDLSRVGVTNFGIILRERSPKATPRRGVGVAARQGRRSWWRVLSRRSA